MYFIKFDDNMEKWVIYSRLDSRDVFVQIGYINELNGLTYICAETDAGVPGQYIINYGPHDFEFLPVVLEAYEFGDVLDKETINIMTKDDYTGIIGITGDIVKDDDIYMLDTYRFEYNEWEDETVELFMKSQYCVL